MTVQGPPRREVRRFLIVDDDPLVCRAMARVLERHGHVDIASGVGEAREALERATYDVILSDDKMPDGKGRTLLALVRDRYPECRRFLMSGDDVPSERDMDPAYEYFLPKPFALAAFLALLGWGIDG
jgi:DNA-binding NtrC family response regulator